MFLTRSHHNDIIREKNLQIGYRDHRIAGLEAERKLLWDKLCLLEIGETVFKDASALRNSACLNRHPEPSANCEVKELDCPSSDATAKNHPGSCGTALGGEKKKSTSEPQSGSPTCTEVVCGGPQPPSAAPDRHPEPGPQSPPAANKYVRLGRPRPSQIMRRMDRLMHNRWLQKLRPAKSARKDREML